MKTLTLFLTIAILTLAPQANAGALIANCTLKANTAVKMAPNKATSWTATKDTAVDAYAEQGQWVNITGNNYEDKNNPEGWVLRSSLYKCVNTKPWKIK